ncbi:MAG: FtsQ-type POTRA domain-containing protein, partial [Clostridia bacterium]|nr:FtsQ-type POTRA domain-containing protein [Clostridia bacterium]
MIVMFLTPLFNIKTVNIVGNNKLTQEQIFAEIGDFNGRNLFSVRTRGIKKKISKFAYTEKVAVKKKPFPSTLTVEITERIPVVQVAYAESFIVIDKDGRILEKTAEKLEGVAVLEGVKVASANEGEFISLKEEETQKIVISCIGNMEKADIIKDVTY